MAPSPDRLLLVRTIITSFLSINLFSRTAAAFTRYADDSCKLLGDSDLYGIGMRVGYYLAYLALLLSVAFKNPRAALDSSKASLLITGVVLIVLLRDTLSGNLAAFEWYLIGHLMNSLNIACSFACVGHGRPAVTGTLLMALGLFAALQPWTVFNLIDQGRREDCQLYTVFFNKFDFYTPGYIIFLKVILTINAVLGGIYVVLGALLLVSVWSSGDAGGYIELPGWANPESSRGIGTILVAGLPAFAFLEAMLIVNSVDLAGAPIASTSQLIPLIAGLAGLVSTIWTVMNDMRHNGGYQTTSGG